LTTTTQATGLKIGWAQCDITPAGPVLVAGQFQARLSEGVLDPLTATALAIDSGEDHVVFVSCDLVSVSDGLRDTVRRHLGDSGEAIDPNKVIFHGTHTHTGPETRLPVAGSGHTSGGTGVDLPATPIPDYVRFAAERIAGAVAEAWRTRAPGTVAYGLGYAVVGRNRRWVDRSGVSTMYGDTNTPDFSHIEGYEDHSLNLLATYGGDGALTGILVNVPCPAQVTEGLYSLSADYWCETRLELRRRLGENLPILAQCSAAGDQSPHLIYEKRAASRMRELTGLSEREEIAQRIAGAVEELLPVIRKTAAGSLALTHTVEEIELPLAKLTEADVETARQEAETLRRKYEEEKDRLDADPELRAKPRWYGPATGAFRRMRWNEGVAERFQQQEASPTRSTEVHTIRLGDIAFATNPYEYYLDYGIHIKARSKAVQTFLVQLAGQGTYVPSLRSTQGGGYGSIPASNPIGPEGGWQLAQRTVAFINSLWPEST
jgi:hypothetical protein